MVGPTIQQDLFAILTRFRTHRFVVTADVAKMYRQVWMAPEHQNFQRILWRFNDSEPISTYNLKTVTYGTSSASFLAIRCLHQLAYENKNIYPQGAAAILRDFYVDDFLSGANSISEAVKLRDQVLAILKKGGFQLRKWASNNKNVLKGFSLSDMENAIIDVDKDSNLKTLGLQWNTQSDSFQFSIKDVNLFQRITKRTILANSAQVFDPLGFLEPITINAKILLQRLWQLKLGWDESVPLDIQTKWLSFRKMFIKLNTIRIPRNVIAVKSAKTIEIHGFSDASESAYGACIYIRSIDHNSAIDCYLLCAKSRVSPLKSLSIPRLELCAAVLLSQLVEKVIGISELKYDRLVFWTDSSKVLNWISSTSRLYNTFVANRISIIQELSYSAHWRHVGSADNPADLISRKLNPNSIEGNKLWWHGPQWLQQDECHWPKSKFINSFSTETLEMRSSAVANVAQIKDDFDVFSKFSSFNKLLRVVGYCFRFYTNSCRKSKISGPLTKQETDRALTALLKYIQEHEFSKEILDLRAEGFVRKDSKIVTLSPFLDNDGVIRVGGRLKNSNLEFENKHPILLPSNHQFTKLLIDHTHKQQLHSGSEGTLAAIRQRYWPISARNTVRKIIRSCVKCFKVNPKFSQPQMSNLPISRVSPARPFSISGADYCGPFLLKEGSRKSKRTRKAYVAVFVCFATKAVHLELVSDLTSEVFIAALKRFCGRRGNVKDLYSDNGTNFVGANRELREIYDFLCKEQVQIDVKNHFSINNMNWHFIPSRSPHFGGLWEAAVKSVKLHMKRVVGLASLTFEELTTLLVEIEAVLNSRPLTPLSNDPNDYTFLTPAHFLIGEPLTFIPEADLQSLKSNRLSNWQRITQLKQHFWARWSKDYFIQLQAKSKWYHSKGKPLHIGQLVILRDDCLPPLRWKTGRISEIHPGTDGVIRTVTVDIGGHHFKRAANKVDALPIEE